MAASDLTVTGNLVDALGTAYDYARTKVWVTFNTANERVTDDEGVVRFDAGAATVNADGSFTIAGIPKPGDSNPTSFQVKIHFDAPPRLAGVRGGLRHKRGDFGWMTITEDAVLADLEDEQSIPAEYQTAFTDAAQAYLDAQAEIAGIDDTDSAVAALIEDDMVGPLTNAALSASTVALLNKRSYNVLEHGAVGDGTTDDITAINALISTVSTAALASGGRGTVFIPPTPNGYKISSQIVWLPGVNIIGDRTKLTISAGINFIRGASTISATRANITANTTISTTNLTVDSSAGFAVGDDVWVQIGQAAYDTGEPDHWYFAKVAAIPDGTHLTLDRPTCYALTVASVSNSLHRSVQKVTAMLESATVSGFIFNNPASGGANAEFGISTYVGRNLVIDQITGINPGAGAIGAQYVDGLHIPSVAVTKSLAQGGQASKGRALSFSECRGVKIGVADLRDCDRAFIIAEARAEVQIDNLVVHNQNLRAYDASTRTETILQTLGTGSKIRVRDYHQLGYPGADLAGGDVRIQNAIFDISSTSPVIAAARYVDRELTMRGGTAYNEIRRKSVQKLLAVNTNSQTVDLPSGILRRLKVYIPTGTVGITSLRVSNKSTNGANVYASLVAGSTVDLSDISGITAINDGGSSPNLLEGKQLLIDTDGTLPVSTVISVEVEYWTAALADDNSAAQSTALYAAPVAGQVLGRTVVSGSGTYSSTSTSFADANNSTVKVTFVAPPTGKVQVMASGLLEVGASTALDANLRTGGADVSGSVGRLAFNNGASALQLTFSRPFNLTGLTAGASYTYQLGIARASGSGTAAIYSGGAAGDLTMWAVAAP